MADKKFTLEKKLDHIAFIMDGNGRWAKKRLLSRSLGHRAGVKNISPIVRECFNTYGIKVVSLFCFSTENWKRPESEISYLFRLLKTFFEDEIESFIKEGVKILINGELDDPRIPSEIIEVFNSATERTKNNTEHIFNILFNYGGRKEFVRVCKSACLDYLERSKKGDTDLDFLNEEYLQKKFDSSLPDVDLLIRTSGEERISNCLLYEIAYAELEFCDEYWPSFSKKDLERCLIEYQSRSRRYGGLKNE